MTINDLHMTEEKHSELSLGFARMLTSAELKSFGASDEEIEKACNFADMMAIADEHKADTPQTDCENCELDGKADVCKICRVSNYEPQTDCGWK